MVNDTISDLLTRVRNAGLAKLTTVDVLYTKMNYAISLIFKKEGFIKAVEVTSADNNTHKKLRLTLKYHERGQKPGITHLKRLSSPSLRIYTRCQDLPRLLNGMGLVIVSTSKGILTDREARAQRVGGELICSIW